MLCPNYHLWRLCLPTTIIGAISFIATSPYARNKFDCYKLLPLWASWLFVIVAVTMSTRNLPNSNQIKALAYFSPYTLGVIHESYPIVTAVLSIFHNWVKFRRRADQLAIDVLSERIRSNRAKRFGRYDLYLPCPSRNSKAINVDKLSTMPGLIFLPGAYVDHTAYSPVAAKISDKGILVAVLSMEPVRVAAPLLGADPADVTRVMKDVSKAAKLRLGSHIRWYIGGHSAGAYAAMRLLKKVRVDKCCIWGAGNIDEFVPDLREESVDILAIFASQDSVAFLSKECKARFMSKMPKHAVIKNIKGGNHAGFAAYPKNELFDGVRKIGLQKQHDLVSSLTASFLLREGKKE